MTHPSVAGADLLELLPNMRTRSLLLIRKLFTEGAVRTYKDDSGRVICDYPWEDLISQSRAREETSAHG